MTALFLAAYAGRVGYFEILLHARASVHTSDKSESLLDTMVRDGQHDLLYQCIERFSLEGLKGGVTS